jgi:hypothetical protein
MTAASSVGAILLSRPRGANAGLELDRTVEMLPVPHAMVVNEEVDDNG